MIMVLVFVAVDKFRANHTNKAIIIATPMKTATSKLIPCTANENHLGKILERAVFFPRYSQDVVVVKACPNS